MPAVSILIPTYNSRYFEQALQSALDQSFRDTEIIVSDDSDTDAAATLVAGKKDSRLRYVRNVPGLGFHGNFAQCHHLAQGKYIKYLNHDDVLRQDCVAQMVDAFEQLGSKVALVFSRRARIDGQGRVMPDDSQTLPLARKNGPFRGAMLANHCLQASANRIGEPTAAMFRRDDAAPDPHSLFCIGGQEFTCLADLALWLRLLAKGDAYYFADPLCGYRVHDEQLQEAAPVRTLCRTERFYLPRAARGLGFIDDTDAYRRILDQAKKHIVWAEERADKTEEETRICTAAHEDWAAEMARLS
jgi:glycosyltransferase involved in cell wall biosynthesis